MFGKEGLNTPLDLERWLEMFLVVCLRVEVEQSNADKAVVCVWPFVVLNGLSTLSKHWLQCHLAVDTT